MEKSKTNSKVDFSAKRLLSERLRMIRIGTQEPIKIIANTIFNRSWYKKRLNIPKG